MFYIKRCINLRESANYKCANPDEATGVLYHPGTFQVAISFLSDTDTDPTQSYWTHSVKKLVTKLSKKRGKETRSSNFFQPQLA